MGQSFFTKNSEYHEKDSIFLSQLSFKSYLNKDDSAFGTKAPE